MRGEAKMMNARTGEWFYAAVRRSTQDPRVLAGVIIIDAWFGRSSRRSRFYAREHDSPDANLVVQHTEWSPEGANPPTPEELDILRVAHLELGKPAELNPLASFFEEELQIRRKMTKVNNSQTVGSARSEHIEAQVVRSHDNAKALSALVVVRRQNGSLLNRQVYFAEDNPGNEDVILWEPSSNHEAPPSMEELVFIRRAHEDLVRKELPFKHHIFAHLFEEG